MAVAIGLITQAMLEEDPKKAAEHLERAEEALKKFKDAIIVKQNEVNLNMGRIVP